MTPQRFICLSVLAASLLLVVASARATADDADLPARAAAAVERGLPLVEQAAER